MGVAGTKLLASMLKKEYSYISSPPLDLHGLFQGESYLALIMCSILNYRRIKLYDRFQNQLR